MNDGNWNPMMWDREIPTCEDCGDELESVTGQRIKCACTYEECPF